MTNNASVYIDPDFGPVARALNWVPAPNYLFRRHRVLKHLDSQIPGRLLEIGCGSGALLSELTVRGHMSTGLETSESAQVLCRKIWSALGAKITLNVEPDNDWLDFFDTIIACEVLEHIEDDIEALTRWGGWLKPGGLLILSVPAHQRMWDILDENAGHVRRYERKLLIKLLTEQNYEIVAFEHYGFPSTNILKIIRRKLHERSVKNAIQNGQSIAEKTAESGSDRSLENKYFSLMNSVVGRLIVKFGILLQQPFLSLDLSPGYLVIAKKTNSDG